MLRFLLPLTLLVPPAFSQPESVTTCRILYFGAPEGAPEKLHLFDGRSSQPVELPRMNLSPVYQVPSGERVLRMLPVPVDDPQNIDPGAPHAGVGEAVTDFYILVSADPSNELVPIRMQIIDVSGSKLDRGDMLWFNLTAKTIGGRLGSQKMVIKPNSRQVLEAPATDHDDYPVNLNFRMPGNERLYPLCETKWLHDPEARTLFFIVNQDGSRTPRILGFPDRREEEAEEP